MTTLLLIRHGESLANREGFFAGQCDVPLEEKGHLQAQLTASFIHSHYAVDQVYASDLCRARDTGKAVADPLGLPVIPEPRLREIFSGQWQGKAFPHIIAQHGQDYRVWLTDIGNCVCTGGESVSQLCRRVCAALEEIARENPGKTVVIATHATPIRAVQCVLGGQPLSRMKDIPWVSNASVTELLFDNGKWALGAIGQDSHLQDLKTTFGANV